MTWGGIVNDNDPRLRAHFQFQNEFKRFPGGARHPRSQTP